MRRPAAAWAHPRGAGTTCVTLHEPVSSTGRLESGQRANYLEVPKCV